jgi:NAD(P)-dependent dehydrogenase (short-subunit alcohol dehydrogenase family)
VAGREAARQFAILGGSVVLAGRRIEALDETAAQCREAGGQALCQVTDVSSEQQVHALAAAALARWGRIDIWVNNAGVTSFARLEDGPMDEHRQVLETNLFGALYGARAAVPVFRKQASGVLINVGSVLSSIGQPFVPSYVISKFALRGLSEALRAEVADQPNISICTLLPYAMDTEHFEAGANHYGRAAHPMPPLQSPEKVARALVQLALHPARQRYVPRAAALGIALHALIPGSVERVVSDALSRWHFGIEAQPDTSGNLFDPRAPAGAVHGTRQPIVSTLRLFSWAFGRFAMMPFERVRTAVEVRRHTPRASRLATTDGRAPALTSER